MKRVLFGVCLLLFWVAPADAGCTYRYNYGYSYSYGSTYYGKSYWPGGYYKGYYYAPGYYNDYYPYTYYDPYFVRYRIVLADLPAYAIYHKETVTVPSTNSTMTPSTPPATDTGLNTKVDEILSLTRQTVTDVADLKRRVSVLESNKPIVDPPAANVVTTEPDLFFNRCAGCHESKVVAEKKSKAVFFVTTSQGNEMAGVDKEGKPRPLTDAELKKIEDELVGKTMPPEKDSSGKVITPLPDSDRNRMIAFIRKVRGKK